MSAASAQRRMAFMERKKEKEAQERIIKELCERSAELDDVAQQTEARMIKELFSHSHLTTTRRVREASAAAQLPKTFEIRKPDTKTATAVVGTYFGWTKKQISCVAAALAGCGWTLVAATPGSVRVSSDYAQAAQTLALIEVLLQNFWALIQTRGCSVNCSNPRQEIADCSSVSEAARIICNR